MEQQGEDLQQLMDHIVFDEAIETRFLELAYTASETGILPFDIKDDVSNELMKLMLLAHHFTNGIPDNLKM